MANSSARDAMMMMTSLKPALHRRFAMVLFLSLQSRKAFAEFADIHSAASSSAASRDPATALLSSLRPEAVVGVALKTALEQCGAAAAAIGELQTARGHVVEARMEALGAKQKEMDDARESLAANVTGRMK